MATGLPAWCEGEPAVVHEALAHVDEREIDSPRGGHVIAGRRPAVVR